MAMHEELIRKESDGTLSFGDYTLDTKSKVSDFEHNGDLYKVKTFYEITKLEKNGMFVYESVPGTAVYNLSITDKEVSFIVTAKEDAQITLELEPEKEYKILIDDINVGKMKTNLGGKLILSVELNEDKKSAIKVVKC
ncbi:endosialidase [Clostridium sp. Marseille-P299]|uniref:endosialidase n=1 Tax=Clostridium sp. Marseille-P299 TaxID=1805477 RepID=UPI000831E30E|nr:endosialidase [Clostridium sp. Marseille-P299]